MMPQAADAFIQTNGKPIISALLSLIVALVVWIFLTQFGGVQGKIDTLQASMDQLRERLIAVDRKVDSLDASIAASAKLNELKLSQIGEALSSTNRRIDDMQADRAKVRESMNSRLEALERLTYIPPTQQRGAR